MCVCVIGLNCFSFSLVNHDMISVVVYCNYIDYDLYCGTMRVTGLFIVLFNVACFGGNGMGQQALIGPIWGQWIALFHMGFIQCWAGRTGLM